MGEIEAPADAKKDKKGQIMTDRIRTLTVTLDKDYRDDDVQSIVSAIQHIKGVALVETRVVDVDELVARSAVRADFQARLHEAVDSVFRQANVRNMVEDRRLDRDGRG